MILERRGTVTGSLATRGLRDVLDMGRQTRPDFSGYSDVRASALVDPERPIEKNERHNADRKVIAALNIGEVEAAALALKELEVATVAISFMHFYRDATHEERAHKVVEQLLPHVYISVSSDEFPKFREFERTSTLVLHAYVWCICRAPNRDARTAGRLIGRRYQTEAIAIAYRSAKEALGGEIGACPTKALDSICLEVVNLW